MLPKSHGQRRQEDLGEVSEAGMGWDWWVKTRNRRPGVLETKEQKRFKEKAIVSKTTYCRKVKCVECRTLKSVVILRRRWIQPHFVKGDEGLQATLILP